MSTASHCICKRPSRGTVATIMLIVYLMISLSPLSALALHSSHNGHGKAVECSGDCNLCGCSPENRAAKTCCCSKKLAQQAARQHDDADDPDCCKTDTPRVTTVITACGCPCNKGTSAVLTSAVSGEIIPFVFAEQFPVSLADTSYPLLRYPLHSRHIEPAVPPPQHS